MPPCSEIAVLKGLLAASETAGFQVMETQHGSLFESFHCQATILQSSVPRSATL